MVTVSVQEIQSNFLHYLSYLQCGESILIMQENHAIAELSPAKNTSIVQRPFALCQQDFIVPDNFDEPLPDDILDAFEGK
ncbi:MAG: type II toxin-antitoxin system Phd/YefM family antitoxin [Moraxellaceae bacterium]|nr:type II toxin-antitoxin system Phd/YefM family antitoxin [Moraxellaceae bacterium]